MQIVTTNPNLVEWDGVAGGPMAACRKASDPGEFFGPAAGVVLAAQLGDYDLDRDLLAWGRSRGLLCLTHGG